jgi:hypothetical protein
MVILIHIPILILILIKYLDYPVGGWQSTMVNDVEFEKNSD